jgi:Holliday junction DNA helicase RuvA
LKPSLKPLKLPENRHDFLNMIGYLNGHLAVKDPTYVIIDVNGVGYEVKISLSTFSKIKDLDQCLVHTYLHVKEDSQTLYGFFDPEEKSMFLHLISISGVGPNTALMINSSLSVEEVRSAIVNDQVFRIQKVKGIGSKTAQRIILELKDKIRKEGYETGISESGGNSLRSEALAALNTLGISKNVAEKSIDMVLRKHGNNLALEDLIKFVLMQA